MITRKVRQGVALAICGASNEHFVVSVKEARKFIRLSSKPSSLGESTLVFIPKSDARRMYSIRAIKITNGAKSTDAYVAVRASQLDTYHLHTHPSKYFYSMNTYQSLSCAISFVRKRMASLHVETPKTEHQINFNIRVHESNLLAARRRFMIKEIAYTKSFESSSKSDHEKKIMHIRIGFENKLLHENGLTFDIAGYLKVLMIKLKSLKSEYYCGTLGSLPSHNRCVLP